MTLHSYILSSKKEGRMEILEKVVSELILPIDENLYVYVIIQMRSNLCVSRMKWKKATQQQQDFWWREECMQVIHSHNLRVLNIVSFVVESRSI